jgi:hypothetical protein
MPDNTESRFFELAADHGRDHADNPEPIQEVGVSIAVPTMTKGGELTEVSHGLIIGRADKLSKQLFARVIPDTRIVETSSHEVAAALLSCGQYVEIDPPTKAVIADHEKATRAHVDAMAKRDKQVEAGNEPAPDATDLPAVIADSNLTSEEQS